MNSKLKIRAFVVKEGDKKSTTLEANLDGISSFKATDITNDDEAAEASARLVAYASERGVPADKLAEIVTQLGEFFCKEFPMEEPTQETQNPEEAEPTVEFTNTMGGTVRVSVDTPHERVVAYVQSEDQIIPACIEIHHRLEKLLGWSTAKSYWFVSEEIQKPLIKMLSKKDEPEDTIFRDKPLPFISGDASDLLHLLKSILPERVKSVREKINEAQARISAQIKRQLTSHKVNGCNDEITITVMDQPGDGGANHFYLVEGANYKNNPSWKGRDVKSTAILFQNGPVPQNGTNGLTHEVLLAILIDRMEGFQNGKFSSTENEVSLGHLRAAQGILKQRTRDRLKRGVEGTHKL